MTNNNNKLCLGKIVGVHGIKGTVKVKAFTEDARDIDNYGILTDKNGKEYNVKVIGESKGTVRVNIKGINDRNMAEELRGIELFASRDVLPEINEDDEYYHADLVNLDVKKEGSDEIVATVLGVYNFGAGDILEIKDIKSKETDMIPFSNDFVPTVDIINGFIIIVDSLELFKPIGEEIRESKE